VNEGLDLEKSFPSIYCMSIADFEHGQSMEDTSTYPVRPQEETNLPICKRKYSKILGHEFDCFDVQVKSAS
jgi:hypothetical protein